MADYKLHGTVYRVTNGVAKALSGQENRAALAKAVALPTDPNNVDRKAVEQALRVNAYGTGNRDAAAVGTHIANAIDLESSRKFKYITEDGKVKGIFDNNGDWKKQFKGEVPQCIHPPGSR